MGKSAPLLQKSRPELRRLLSTFGEFRRHVVGVEVLQRILLSATESLTGWEDRELRGHLENAENRIEFIRFTVAKDRVADVVLPVLEAVETRLKGGVEEA